MKADFIGAKTVPVSLFCDVTKSQSEWEFFELIEVSSEKVV